MRTLQRRDFSGRPGAPWLITLRLSLSWCAFFYLTWGWKQFFHSSDLAQVADILAIPRLHPFPSHFTPCTQGNGANLCPLHPYPTPCFIAIGNGCPSCWEQPRPSHVLTRPSLLRKNPQPTSRAAALCSHILDLSHTASPSGADGLALI